MVRLFYKRHGMDIDIAVYAAEQVNPYQLSADLKIKDLALNSSHDQRH